MRLLVVLALAASITPARSDPLPDLAQLKLAAEAGDPVAEYEYGHRVHDQTERFSWFMKSAQQGYAPAQDAVAEHFAFVRGFESDPRKKKALDRDAARWASHAAYQGNASAQRRLSNFYKRGIGVTADPLKTYMWAQIAVDTTGGDRGQLTGLMDKVNRDALITTTPSETIKLGQQMAREFKPTNYAGLNPVEADLVFAGLNLSSIFKMNDRLNAVVNGVRFGTGESKKVNVDGQTGELTCLAIEGKAATFLITGTNYQAVLHLAH